MKLEDRNKIVSELLRFWEEQGAKARDYIPALPGDAFEIFASKLSIDELYDAIITTMSRGRPNYYKYFCGICWNKIKASKD